MNIRGSLQLFGIGFSVAAIATNVLIFDHLGIGQLGFLMPLTEMVSGAYMIWAAIAALHAIHNKPVLALLLASTSTWMFFDRSALALAYW